MNWKATFADDWCCPRPPGALTLGLDRDALALGGFVIGSTAAFDEPRAAAFLAAAYGEAVSASALGYVRRAIGRQREGEMPLALICLALAGLPPLVDPAAARDRLSKAMGLMKSGVAPATIIEALAPNLAVQRAYDPDQPRVPAGNGEISGQWTKEGGSPPTPERSFDAVSASPKPGTKEPQRTRIADNSANWLQFLSPVESAEAAERDGKPFNGVGPNQQHGAAVKHAISLYEANGFEVVSPGATVVEINGFTSPRIYDFLAEDPVTGRYFGVEVKTTLYDTIFFDRSQVDKDVAIYLTGGGYAPSLGVRVTRVAYENFCNFCSVINLKYAGLALKLLAAGIPVRAYRFPGEGSFQ